MADDGQIHAQNCVRMVANGSPCQLVAIVEPQAERREAWVAELTQQQGSPVRGFASVHQLLEATTIEAAVVSSTTSRHYANAKALVQAGCRVLLEKPIFPLPPTASVGPEFVARFGPAYARELVVFLDHLTQKTAFPVDQNDGLRATEVLENAQAV